MIEFIYNYALLALMIYEFILFLYIIASWFGGLPRNRLGYFVEDLMRPALNFVKQIPHSIGPVDISPIYVFILIALLRAGLVVLYSFVS